MSRRARKRRRGAGGSTRFRRTTCSSESRLVDPLLDLSARQALRRLEEALRRRGRSLRVTLWNRWAPLHRAGSVEAGAPEVILEERRRVRALARATVVIPRRVAAARSMCRRVPRQRLRIGYLLEVALSQQHLHLRDFLAVHSPRSGSRVGSCPVQPDSDSRVGQGCRTRIGQLGASRPTLLRSPARMVGVRGMRGFSMPPNGKLGQTMGPSGPTRTARRLSVTAPPLDAATPGRARPPRSRQHAVRSDAPEKSSLRGQAIR